MEGLLSLIVLYGSERIGEPERKQSATQRSWWRKVKVKTRVPALAARERTNADSETNLQVFIG